MCKSNEKIYQLTQKSMPGPPIFYDQTYPISHQCVKILPLVGWIKCLVLMNVLKGLILIFYLTEYKHNFTERKMFSLNKYINSNIVHLLNFPQDHESMYTFKLNPIHSYLMLRYPFLFCHLLPHLRSSYYRLPRISHLVCICMPCRQKWPSLRTWFQQRGKILSTVKNYIIKYIHIILQNIQIFRNICSCDFFIPVLQISLLQQWWPRLSFQMPQSWAMQTA